MNLQDIFDSTARHLITQGRPALDRNYDPADRTAEGNGCLYRGPNGTKCAFGFHIPDDVYDERMEGNPASLLLDKYPELSEFKPFEGLIEELQGVHDDRSIHRIDGTFDMPSLKSELREVADQFELSPAVLEG